MIKHFQQTHLFALNFEKVGSILVSACPCVIIVISKEYCVYYSDIVHTNIEKRSYV